MFGIAVARLDQVSFEEKERYKAFYCGVCRSLKKRYGQLSRITLSYDLAFLAIFLDSLNESEQLLDSQHCVAHSGKSMPYLKSPSIEYAADLSVALAYHKVLDDVEDDNSLKARTSERALRSAYAATRERIPVECEAVEACMAEISRLERAEGTDPDACAHAFGRLLAVLFSYRAELCKEGCARFGYELGRLIYLMDAAIDLEDDRRTGSYNPFVSTDVVPENIHSVLWAVAADAADAFERLPIIQDEHLMRAVLYAGVWQKYNLKVSVPSTTNETA